MKLRVNTAACLIGTILAANSPLAAPSIIRDGEFEKMVLGNGGNAGEWSPEESAIEASGKHAAKPDRTVLHWSVPVDYSAGEAAYPIGWPRVRREIPEGPERDWSGWDFLRLRVFTDTSRPALPSDPVGMNLYMPDKSSAYERPLTELKKGGWTEILVPVAKMPHPGDVRTIQFYISESDYRDHDRLDLFFDEIALLRYAEPSLFDFSPENQVMFADARYIPVRFRLAGVGPDAEPEVTCALLRTGAGSSEPVTRTAWKAKRDAGRYVLDLGSRRIVPGEYEMTAKVAGGSRSVSAHLRVVESPW